MPGSGLNTTHSGEGIIRSQMDGTFLKTLSLY